MQTFRLIRAETHQKGGPNKAERPVIAVDLSRSASSGPSAISIIIGSNGTGKSRLLGDIAETFLHLSERDYRKRKIPLDYLAYSIDGKLFQIGRSPDTIFDLPLSQMVPARVIAVAMTPFDKFPLGSASSSPKHDPDHENFYHYIGMRDRMNRASVTALLYRSIEQLMRRRDGGSRSRIRDVFDLLGYFPVINVGLRIDLSASEFDGALTKQMDFGDVIRGGFMRERLVERLRSGKVDEYELRGALDRISKHGISNRRIRLGINLENPQPEEIDFDDLAFLRRVGLLRLESMEVVKKTGEPIDLRSASSGEISIFTTFVSISSVLEDGSLILIDEPETSLHPEWQKQFVDLLTNTFQHFNGCHFILSTHSPLIVGDTPTNSSVFSMDNNAAIDGSEVSNRSPDYLLATAFHSATPTNSFVRDEIIRGLRLSADGRLDSVEYAEVVKSLTRLLPDLGDAGPVTDLIKELIAAPVQRD